MKRLQLRGVLAPRFAYLCVMIGLGAMLGATLGGCTRISIQPSCPATLRVGESGPVSANEIGAGAIPTYTWEVFPADAGVFTNAAVANTSFEARALGDLVIRLTASDGLFQVISQCTTRVEGFLGVAVTLTADPSPALVGESVTLTCTDEGTIVPVVLAITQVGGGDVALEPGDAGTVSFVTTEIGDLDFRCVGESADGTQTDPAIVTVTVNQTLPPEDGGTGDGNMNDNGGRDGGRVPPRPGRGGGLTVP